MLKPFLVEDLEVARSWERLSARDTGTGKEFPEGKPNREGAACRRSERAAGQASAAQNTARACIEIKNGQNPT